jgi:hypothetical protein
MVLAVDVDEEMEEDLPWEIYGAVVAEVDARVHETLAVVVKVVMQVMSVLMV